jgi:hypothetical protein
MKLFLLLGLIGMGLIPVSHAQLGMTEKELTAQYGQPRSSKTDNFYPEIKRLEYEKDGTWYQIKILEEKAQYIVVAITNFLGDYNAERQKLLEANGAGKKWVIEQLGGIKRESPSDIYVREDREVFVHCPEHNFFRAELSTSKWVEFRRLKVEELAKQGKRPSESLKGW